MLNIYNYQLVLFFTNPINRPDKFFSDLNEASGNLFDKMPKIVPLPPEAPPEIPRVSSSNSSGLYTINVSFSRMDFAINNIEKGLKEVDITSDFISKSKLIIKNLPDNIYLNRIGIIGSFFEFEKSPAISLARKIIKKDLGNVSEFNFRYNKLSSDFGHTFNNILSINNAIFEAENASHHSEGILIQKDINNIPTENPISKDLLIEMLLKKIKELGTEHIEGSL